MPDDHTNTVNRVKFAGRCVMCHEVGGLSDRDGSTVCGYCHSIYPSDWQHSPIFGPFVDGKYDDATVAHIRAWSFPCDGRHLRRFNGNIP